MAAQDEVAARRFKVTLELFEAGVAMMREKLRREHPEWADTAVEAAVAAWLRERPGAEHGDAVGRPVRWPRQPA